MPETENYFTLLDKSACKTEKKNNLTYVSWADAWKIVKEQHADSTYTIYENAEWFPFWESKFGIDVKVWVTINGIEHIVRLPVMDGANKSMKFEKYTYDAKYWQKTCDGATSFDINKTIQRAFTKAIAMHGIWLYVYRGEDFPDDVEWEEKKQEKPKEPVKIKDKFWDTNYRGFIDNKDKFKTYEEAIEKIESVYDIDNHYKEQIKLLYTNF